MTDAHDPLIRAFGPPSPETPPGLHFRGDWEALVWRKLHAQSGAGYYWDRFLFLFGEGLERLHACLDAWSFVVPDDGVERMIVGRNAYGTLLVLESPNDAGPRSRIAVLDPIGVTYRRHPDIDFVGLIGHWLPEKQLPDLLDRGVYDAWRSRTGRYLEPEHILAPKKPLGLGGAMQLDNFQDEEILTYYRTTAPIYARAFATTKGRASSSPPAGTSLRAKEPAARKPREKAAAGNRGAGKTAARATAPGKTAARKTADTKTTGRKTAGRTTAGRKTAAARKPTERRRR